MKTQVTITMDKELKEQLKVLSAKAGTTLSNLINMLGTDVVRRQKIELNLADEVMETPEMIAAREAAMADFHAGKNIYTWEDFEDHLSGKKTIPDV